MASLELRARAEANFKAAADRLEGAIPKEIHSRLGQIECPNFNDALQNATSVEDRARDLESVLETFIQRRREIGSNDSRRKKVKDVIVRWFRASHPFLNLFLSLLKEGSGRPCGGIPTRCPVKIGVAKLGRDSRKSRKHTSF
jgi:uncharacterized membrane-anchored protein YjiN (DUF445 family)